MSGEVQGWNREGHRMIGPPAVSAGCCQDCQHHATASMSRTSLTLYWLVQCDSRLLLRGLVLTERKTATSEDLLFTKPGDNLSPSHRLPSHTSRLAS